MDDGDRWIKYHRVYRPRKNIFTTTDRVTYHLGPSSNTWAMNAWYKLDYVERYSKNYTMIAGQVTVPRDALGKR